ncbi:hypothetical protein MN608_11490 [Microdochium nivale]|nr:hypothetical protein MN608_11490 [Microdochium nivale]
MRVCRGFHHHGSFTRLLPATWFDSPRAFSRCRICHILDINPVHEGYGIIRANFTCTRSALRATAQGQPGATELCAIGYLEREPMIGSWGKPVYDDDDKPARLPSIFESYLAERRMDV